MIAISPMSPLNEYAAVIGVGFPRAVPIEMPVNEFAPIVADTVVFVPLNEPKEVACENWHAAIFQSLLRAATVLPVAAAIIEKLLALSAPVPV